MPESDETPFVRAQRELGMLFDELADGFKARRAELRRLAETSIMPDVIGLPHAIQTTAEKLKLIELASCEER